MKTVGVIGTGYVGLVHAAVMAEYGYNIIAMDSDREKINMIKQGVLPIYEPDLAKLVQRNTEEGRLHFTEDIQYAVEQSDIVFIAVGTPQQEDGSADLQYVKTVARQIGAYINKYMIIVNKSTVPVGTGTIVESLIDQELIKRNVKYSFDVVSNPEFLREGMAVLDSIHPDRIVVGTESNRAKEIMAQLYRPFKERGIELLFTNRKTSEMIKYSSNAFLAVKISFINEMALLAEKVGADVQQISKAMGMDSRISEKFLKAGPGYGGSCFPKDTRAIVNIGMEHGEELLVVNAAIQANQKQMEKSVAKICEAMHPVTKDENRTIAVWGLSFKPETDDMRESPAIYILTRLVEMGYQIQAYCPKGMEEAKWRLEKSASSITYCQDEYAAVTNADALVIITDWQQFRNVDMKRVVHLMKQSKMIDLRNMFYEEYAVQSMFDYHGLGC